MNGPFWHVGVLIPARDEEELLPRCLRSVRAACKVLPASVTVDLVVVVDSSSDRTLEIAQKMVRGMGVVMCANLGVAGQARGLAAALALDRYEGDPSRCWLANTDADCIVPKQWLASQIALAATGVEAVAGTVDVDTFREHDAIVEARFRETYLIRQDGWHSHVHAANLGVRTDAYLRAGGWHDLATGEDHDLWRRLEAIGARRLSTSRIEVLTSGRRVGRAPHGFAEALGAHNPVMA